MILHRGYNRILEHLHRIAGFVLQLQFHGIHQVVERLLVFLYLGEVQVDQLEHGLHIRRCRATANRLLALCQVDAGIGNLSSQGLSQFGRREATQSAGVDYLVEHTQVRNILFRIE